MGWAAAKRINEMRNGKKASAAATAAAAVAASGLGGTRSNNRGAYAPFSGTRR